MCLYQSLIACHTFRERKSSVTAPEYIFIQHLFAARQARPAAARALAHSTPPPPPPSTSLWRPRSRPAALGKTGDPLLQFESESRHCDWRYFAPRDSLKLIVGNYSSLITDNARRLRRMRYSPRENTYRVLDMN